MERRQSGRVQISGFFRMILPAVAILITGVIVIFGVLVYKISNPGTVPETATPSHYLLPSLEVTIPSKGGIEIPAWWIPGLKNAPGIILAPGYEMSRSDALSLGSALHENGFNILIYEQRGSGAAPWNRSTLGLYEPEDMRAAIQYLQGRTESNPARMGIWGVDVGASAALKVAASFPQVRAIAADSAFDMAADFVDYRITEDFGLENRLLQFGCYRIFRLAHIFDGTPANETIPVQALSDRMILFVKGDNRKALGNLTTAIYDRIKPQKEMISFKIARVRTMSGEDLKSYDRQVANFFHLNLQ